MIADSIIEQVLKGLHGEGDPFYDLEEDELPLVGPVARLSLPETEPRVELESFHPDEKTPWIVDRQTTTAAERRQIEDIGKQMSDPGSSGSFRAAEEASLPSEKRWFRQENGKIDVARMTPIEKGSHYMKPSAAMAYKAMQRAARKDGINFAVTDSYRTYDQQVALKAAKPTLAATPGKSNHGWGIALDINVNDPKVYNWLKKNGKRFGFDQPMDYEPWHWEYEGGYEPSSSGRRKRPKPKVTRTPREQTDAMSLIRATSSGVLAPMSFASVLGELQESKPTTRKQYESHKKAGGLGFVPAKYRDWFRQAGERFNVSPRLLAAMANTETGGFAKDVINFQRDSSAGAKGMMQVMPLHEATYGDKFMKSVKENIMVGAAIFASYLNAAQDHHLSRQYNPIRLALSMYNAGPNASDSLLISRMSAYSDPILNLWKGRG